MSASSRSPRVLVLGVEVADTRGGAELLVEKLMDAFRDEGAEVSYGSLPFSALPKSRIVSQMAQWRAFDLRSLSDKEFDFVVPTKFPTYFVKHPRKIPWLIHQHRQAYELYGTRFGDFSTEAEDESLRRMIIAADEVSFRECRAIYTISQNVSNRLKRYLDLDSTALEPPLPLLGRYYRAEAQNYILSVGRLCSIKRVDMMIKAMPLIRDSLSLKIVGAPDEPAIAEYLESEIEKHHLWHRVEFLGRVSEEELLSLYAQAFLVYYAPFDEDYGFVTLEALASGCPVVTASDSGCVLEYIRHGENGIVVEPNIESLAIGVNELLSESSMRQRLAEACHYEAKRDWRAIAREFLAGAA